MCNELGFPTYKLQKTERRPIKTATREENIKKINDKLEIMSDEELDLVAGGNCYETADDSRFLNSLANLCDRYGATTIAFFSHDEEIVAAWDKVGVKAYLSDNILKNEASANIYYINGQRVTQEQARQHAMQVTGHYMSRSDWDW